MRLREKTQFSPVQKQIEKAGIQYVFKKIFQISPSV